MRQEIVRHTVPEDIQAALDAAVLRHSGDKTVAYRMVAGCPLYLSYYYPPAMEAGKVYPTLLFVHGGSWDSHKIFDDQPGWQGDYLGFLARYFSQKGYLCVSIDYRLLREEGQAPGYQLDDLCDDCAEAVRYVLEHAAAEQVDPHAMAVLGESAGGYLAGALATFPQAEAFSFRCAVLVNPITDLVNDPVWRTRVPRQSAPGRLAGLDEAQRRQALSPLCQITDATCPVILLHGAQDTLVSPEHSTGFYREMVRHGRVCVLHLLEQTDHAFLLAEYTDNLAACKLGIQILENELKNYLPL